MEGVQFLNKRGTPGGLGVSLPLSLEQQLASKRRGKSCQHTAEDCLISPCSLPSPLSSIAESPPPHREREKRQRQTERETDRQTDLEHFIIQHSPSFHVAKFFTISADGSHENASPGFV